MRRDVEALLTETASTAFGQRVWGVLTVFPASIGTRGRTSASDRGHFFFFLGGEANCGTTLSLE